MIRRGMARKVFGNAVNALGAVVDAARHVAWYVSYQVEGRTRDADARRRRRD